MTTSNRAALVVLAFCATVTFTPSNATADESAANPEFRSRGDADVIDIGSRRELFVDNLLIEQLDGTQLKMHEPTLLRPAHAAQPPRPFGHYATVIKDTDRYRLYYRGDVLKGLHWRKDGWDVYHANEITEYAESKDGFTWSEPKLNVHEIEAFPEGNVILANRFLVNHNFSPFIDEQPDVPEEQRYKALGGVRYPDANWGGWRDETHREEVLKKYGPGGLYAFVSSDAIHWKKLHESAVIPEGWGSFDSQNVAFWSEAEQQYAAYFRWIDKGWRSIRRSTSKDFIHWTEPVDMKANLPNEHLYTNGTHPYFRAPHIYIALPTRFQAKRSSITDVVFMTARPGSDRYERAFKEAFIRPGLGPSGWGNRSNYVAWHVVPTSDSEMSMYMYGGGHYTLRTDGFISVHAGYDPGNFTTKPFVFRGTELDVNYATSAAGGIRVEIQNPAGEALDGFTLEDSDLLYGDEISHIVTWKQSSDVSKLSGQPIRLHFAMNEADLYSIRFMEKGEQ